MQVLGILQARMTSTRLPGKVLKPVLGEPILQYQIGRLRRSRKISRLVLATSTETSDDILEKLARDMNLDCFRGSLDNALKRFYDCALQFKGDVIVRLTGDCPVTDPDIIDRLIDLHIKTKADFTSNTMPRTFPIGLDVEVLNFKILEKLVSLAKSQRHFEHVTYYIYEHPEEFHVENLCHDKDYSQLRWTLDTAKDYLYLKNMIERQKNRDYRWQDLLAQVLEKEPPACI